MNRKRDGSIYTRFEVGDELELNKIREMSRERRVLFEVTIIQPGVLKDRISNSQLELLSVTENYLIETYEIPFKLISS